jgi:hypothetical protein
MFTSFVSHVLNKNEKKLLEALAENVLQYALHGEPVTKNNFGREGIIEGIHPDAKLNGQKKNDLIDNIIRALANVKVHQILQMLRDDNYPVELFVSKIIHGMAQITHGYLEHCPTRFAAGHVKIKQTHEELISTGKFNQQLKDEIYTTIRCLFGEDSHRLRKRASSSSSNSPQISYARSNLEAKNILDNSPRPGFINKRFFNAKDEDDSSNDKGSDIDADDNSQEEEAALLRNFMP